MKSCLFILLVLMAYHAAFGVELPAIAADTTPRKMRPVDVTADYLSGKKQASFAPLTILSGEQLTAVGAWQVSDAMHLMPSAFVKNYGGLSAFKSISLRATTSQQTLVLLDGIRLASSATGTSDLSAIPLLFFDDIELSGGGASAQFGAGAIAGVVNLLTRHHAPSSATVNLAGGSFGDALFSASANRKLFGMYWRAGVEVVRSDGDYPFQSREYGIDTTLRRSNSDYRTLGLTLAGTAETKGWTIANRIFIRTAERGTPGAVLQGKVEQLSARLGEDDVLLVHSSKRMLSDYSALRLSGSARYANLRYDDTDALYRGPGGAHDLYITREAMLAAALDHYGTVDALHVHLEWTGADLRGNTFQPEVGTFVGRHTFSLSASIDNQWHLDSVYALAAQLQARYDVHSSAPNAFSPLAAMTLSTTDIPVRFRGSWSYNFRLPSFNELYYFNYGTASLRPERAHSLNLGLLWQPHRLLSIEGNGFLISTNDQILAVPKSPIAWSAQNIGKVLSRGVECSVTGEPFNGLLTVRLSYTRQKATDESDGSPTSHLMVPTIPQELFSAALSCRLWTVATLGTTVNYSSFRYFTADNSPEYLLPSYAQVNIYGEYTIEFMKTAATARIECTNLLNEQYAVIVNYPMPSRSFRLGMRLKFSDIE